MHNITPLENWKSHLSARLNIPAVVLCEVRKSTSKYLFYLSKWWILGKTKLVLSNCCSNCTSNNLAPAFFGNYYQIKETGGFAVQWEQHLLKTCFIIFTQIWNEDALSPRAARSTGIIHAKNVTLLDSCKPGLCCAKCHTGMQRMSLLLQWFAI